MGEWIRGMDLSTLPEVEECGGRFFDHKREGKADEILKAYGMNLIRLRLFHDPYSEEGVSYGGGTCDLKRVMEMARRAKCLGTGWMLDFHYSDFWADPGKQLLPKAWQALKEEELEETVYKYTYRVMEELKKKELLPEIAAPGNELSNGLLWPYGKVPAWSNIARYVSAGIRAIREVSQKTKVMVHLDQGGDCELYCHWFDRYFEADGEDFDYIGLSYYPFWHGPMEGLKENMHMLAERYKKPMIVAETSMGFTLEDYAEYEKLPNMIRSGMAAKRELAEKIRWPMTPEGQCSFFKDLIETIRSVPNALGRGFVCWEPAWIPVPGSGWASPAAFSYIGESGKIGNEWANQALFDYDGNALPALSVIGG